MRLSFVAHVGRELTGTQQRRSLLRWAGSKRHLVPTLMQKAPREYGRYFEPFAGSASLFFALNPASAVLGDINVDLISTYKTLQSNCDAVLDVLFAWGEPCSEYYPLRSLTVDSLSPIQRAARFLYLNRHCFNGVYRTNKQGAFNVPLGRNTGRMPTPSAFRLWAGAFRDVEFRAGDFEGCLNDVAPGDFVYMDPPYFKNGRGAYGEYGYERFTERDVGRLLGSLCNIEERGAKFVLSYSDNLPSEVLRRWTVELFDVRRNVAGFGRSRGLAREVLVSNY